MRSRIVVQRIKPVNQTYISDLGSDKAFVSKDNPKGLFRTVVQPILDNNGDYVIKYTLNEYETFERSRRGHIHPTTYCRYNGYLVSGEGYIVTGKDDDEIMRKCRRYLRMKFENAYAKLVGPGGSSEDTLW